MIQAFAFNRPVRYFAMLAIASVLSACAGSPTASVPSLSSPTPELPASWQAPLPHGGQLTDLRLWWQQFNDPLLTQLIDTAQAVSPSVAAAKSRIEQSRAARVGAGAALVPTLGANAVASRAKPDLYTPLVNNGSAGLQASWELDLFGGNRAARDAAEARLNSAEAAWHDARVSVAAEVATSYTSLRACEAQLVQTQMDAASRAETARLTELSAGAGFQAPANAALARASAAQSHGSVTQQRTRCDLNIKALVALSAMDEAALRSQLAAATARLPQPAQIAVASVPAQALAQRPDLLAAAAELLAAGSDISQAAAQRLPRISLNGSISRAHVESALGNSSGTVWSVGPVEVSLPLFDGGARIANVDAARARYDNAVVAYQGRLRGAVREVEEALVVLQGTADQNVDAQLAVDGFTTSLRATEARYRSGMASLFELEDARRSAVLAQNTLIELQRERVAAWISLYRALGGAWPDNEAQATADDRARSLKAAQVAFK